MRESDKPDQHSKWKFPTTGKPYPKGIRGNISRLSIRFEMLVPAHCYLQLRPSGVPRDISVLRGQGSATSDQILGSTLWSFNVLILLHIYLAVAPWLYLVFVEVKHFQHGNTTSSSCGRNRKDSRARSNHGAQRERNSADRLASWVCRGSFWSCYSKNMARHFRKIPYHRVPQARRYSNNCKIGPVIDLRSQFLACSNYRCYAKYSCC